MYYVPYKCQVCLFLTFMHFFFNIAQHFFFFFQTLILYHLWKKISNKRLYYAFLSFFFLKKTFNFSKFEQQQQQQKWENIKGIFFQEKKNNFHNRQFQIILLLHIFLPRTETQYCFQNNNKKFENVNYVFASFYSSTSFQFRIMNILRIVKWNKWVLWNLLLKYALEWKQ